jgi:hypothetical protein
MIEQLRATTTHHSADDWPLFRRLFRTTARKLRSQDPKAYQDWVKVHLDRMRQAQLWFPEPDQIIYW